MNVHVHVEWLQECYEYGTSYGTWDPLFRTFFYLSCTAGCVCGGHWHRSPSTSSSLVMSWSGSRLFLRLPSSSPSAYTLLLMSYYGNTATSPSENQVKM